MKDLMFYLFNLFLKFVCHLDTFERIYLLLCFLSPYRNKGIRKYLLVVCFLILKYL